MWRPLLRATVGALPGGELALGVARLGPAELRGVLPQRFDRFSGLFSRLGSELGVNSGLLAAVARWESAYDPRAVGDPIPPTGQRAHGLMQVTERNLRDLGAWGARYDPETNVRSGARILLSSGFGREPLGTVLAAYSGSLEDGEPDPNSPAAKLYRYRVRVLWWRFIVWDGLN